MSSGRRCWASHNPAPEFGAYIRSGMGPNLNKFRRNTEVSRNAWEWQEERIHTICPTKHLMFGPWIVHQPWLQSQSNKLEIWLALQDIFQCTPYFQPSLLFLQLPIAHASMFQTKAPHVRPTMGVPVRSTHVLKMVICVAFDRVEKLH